MKLLEMNVRRLSLLLGTFGLLLLALGDAQTHNPGLALRINSPGLTFLKDNLLEQLRVLLSSEEFPPVIDDVGSTRTYITNIRTERFDFGNTMFVARSPNVFTASTTGGSITIRGNFRVLSALLRVSFHELCYTFIAYDHSLDTTLRLYRLPTIWASVSGTVTITASSVQFNQSIGICNDHQERPTFVSTGCSGSIGNLNIRVSDTGWAWLLNAVADLFLERNFKRQLSTKICAEIPDWINTEGQKLTEDYRRNILISRSAQINLGLTRCPVANSNGFAVYLRGRSYSPAHNPEQRFPFNAPVLPALSRSSRMAQISMSDYALNTLAYSLWQEEYFSNHLSQSDITSVLSIDESTLLDAVGQGHSSMQRTIHSGGLQAAIDSPIPPSIVFNRSGLAFAGEFRIRIPTGSAESDISFILTVSALVTLAVDGNRIRGRVVSIDAGIKTIVGIPGVPDELISAINHAIDVYFPMLALPILNEATNVGFVIPETFGIQPRQLSLEFKEHALELAGNFQNS